MNECPNCTRMVDDAGLCDDCRLHPPKVQRVTAHGHSRGVTGAMPTNVRWGASVRDRILSMTAAGMSTRTIAFQIGCSSRTVERVRSESRAAA